MSWSPKNILIKKPYSSKNIVVPRNSQTNRHPSLFPHAPLRTLRDGAVAPTDIVQPAPSRRVHAALGRAEGKPLEPAAALSVSASYSPVCPVVQRAIKGESMVIV
jgi:hypothetical protein